MKDKLLQIASTFSSPEEFKDKDLPNYLKAKRLRLLRIAFPPINKDKPLKGIYKLYKDKKVVFIGHALDNLLEAIKSDSKAIVCNNYKYYILNSDSDIVTLYTYLVNKYRPLKNTDVAKQELSFIIPNVSKILGKYTKGTL